MKKYKLGKLITTVCALLAFVLVFSFTACNTDDGDNGGGTGGSNGLTLNSYSLSLDEGSTSPLLVTSIVTEDVVWSSSDESKVTVEGSGNGKRMGTVTAVAKGSATITATSGSSNATCVVTVVEKETITITQNGSAVTSDISLNGEGSTVQLAATSSRGHSIAWESSKPLIATVSDSGLVTAVAASGTVEIVAVCDQHSNVTESVTVVIGSGADAAYNLKQGDENGQYGNYNSNDNPGVWVYWNQYTNVANASYDNGVVSLQTVGIEDGAVWHNVQLFYTATAADKDTAGNVLTAGTHYQLDIDFETSMAGHITVNGYVLALQEGVNHCTLYYDHTIKYGQVATAIAIQLGVEGVGCDITNANIKISNWKWTASQKVDLVAPTFSIANNVITINDSNPAGSVGSYTLNLYTASGSSVGAVTVVSGQTVNTSRIKPNGTYTGKLVANAANAHYVTAPEAASANASVTVNNESIIYTMSGGDEQGKNAVKELGTWTYWSSWWVENIVGQVNGDEATISFSNNTGFWYDMQMFYKMPGKKVGDTYSIKLHIDNVPNAGKISVNGATKNLTAGNNVLDITITETSKASIEVIFGVVNAADHTQEITTVNNLKVYFELV